MAQFLRLAALCALVLFAACGGKPAIAPQYAKLTRAQLVEEFAKDYQGRTILARAVTPQGAVVHENRIRAVAGYGFTYLYGPDKVPAFWPFAARPVLEQPMLHPYYQSYALSCGDTLADAPMPPAQDTCRNKPIHFASRDQAEAMLDILSALHKSFEPVNATEPAPPAKKPKARLK